MVYQTFMEYNNVSTNMTNTSLDLLTVDLDHSQLVTLPLYILIFLMAVSGNTLVIITLVQNKRMRTVTNVFLLNLSISDLLLAVFCMPFTLIPLMLQNFVFGPTMCVMIRYLQGVSVGVSCFTLVSISLERYFAICKPLHSRKWQTLAHSYRIISVCWFLAAVVMIPIAIFTKHTIHQPGLASCREEWSNIALEQAYTAFLDLCLLLVPLLVMTAAYSCVIHTLWRGIQCNQLESALQGGRMAGSQLSLEMNSYNSVQHYGTTGKAIKDNKDLTPVTRRRTDTASSAELVPTRKMETRRVIRQSNPERSRAAKLRVIRMLATVVVEFFVCWTPLYTVQTWKTFHLDSAKEHMSNMTWSFILVLAYVSSSCNPITYCFMNSKFRQSFLQVLGCCQPTPRRHFSSRSGEQPSSIRLNGTRQSIITKSNNCNKLCSKDMLITQDKCTVYAQPNEDGVFL